MNTMKFVYDKPEIEIISLEGENVIASSLRIDDSEEVSGPARSKRRSIWSDGEE